MILPLALLLAPVLAPVQGAPAPPSAPGEASDEPGASQDPFFLAPEAREVLGRLLAPQDAPQDAFQRLDEAPRLPAMHLRGYVRMRERSSGAALVQVVGIGYYTVHEGEQIAFSAPWSHVVRTPGGSSDAAASEGARRSARTDPLPVVLRVREVRRDGVVVEVGTLGELLIIR